MQRLLTPRETDRILRYPHGRSIRLAKQGKLSAIILPDGEYRFAEKDIEVILLGRHRSSKSQVEAAM